MLFQTLLSSAAIYIYLCIPVISFPWCLFFLSAQDHFGRPVMILQRCHYQNLCTLVPAFPDYSLISYRLHPQVPASVLIEMPPPSLTSLIAITRVPLVWCIFTMTSPVESDAHRVDATYNFWLGSKHELSGFEN